MKVKRILEKCDFRSLDLVNIGIDGLSPKTELFKFDISLPDEKLYNPNAKVMMRNNLSPSSKYRRSYLINLRGYVLLKIPNAMKEKMVEFLSLTD